MSEDAPRRRTGIGGLAIASVVLGVASLAAMLLGAVLVAVPIAGVMLAFVAPALTVAGAILGGTAVHRADAIGASRAVAIVGLVINIVLFVPAVGVALTCGLCSVVLGTSEIEEERPRPEAWDPSAPSPGLSPPPRRSTSSDLGPRGHPAPP